MTPQQRRHIADLALYHAMHGREELAERCRGMLRSQLSPSPQHQNTMAMEAFERNEAPSC